MEYFWYVITIMLALGELGMAWFVVFDRYNTLSVVIVSALIAIPVWVFVGLGPIYAVYDIYREGEFTLTKSHWRCTAGHNEQSTSYVQSGQVMVPITSTSFVCDQYNRQ